jgi:peptidase E
MGSAKGIIALMGSGELTSTMVEVHKDLLSRCGSSPRAVFIDTPAGFQLNADQLSEKAVDYFRTRVGHPLSVASFKSAATLSPYDAERAYRALREADYFLIGPGSPTYAVRQWQHSPIPGIISSRVAGGACLIAASAAALTVGRLTLPVYEIYKVGEPLHWIEGIDVLGSFGFNLVVVPHWNNAEGGNHDTRFCYMGEPRFHQLAAQLPADTGILGLDEHTACMIDLQQDVFTVRGLGRACLRMAGAQRYFEKGTSYPISLLKGTGGAATFTHPSSVPVAPAPVSAPPDDSFWNTVNQMQAAYRQGIDSGIPENAVNAMLELDSLIWKAQEDLETQEFISQAREIMRDMIVALGTGVSASPNRYTDCLAPLVEGLLALRNGCRQQHKWEAADAIRSCLMKARIHIEDTKDGSTWHIKPA